MTFIIIYFALNALLCATYLYDCYAKEPFFASPGDPIVFSYKALLTLVLVGTPVLLAMLVWGLFAGPYDE